MYSRRNFFLPAIYYGTVAVTLGTALLAVLAAFFTWPAPAALAYLVVSFLSIAYVLGRHQLTRVRSFFARLLARSRDHVPSTF